MKDVEQLNLFSRGVANAKLRRQRQLIANCIQSGVELADGLRDLGWTYDDLQYEINDRPKIARGRAATLNDFSRKPNGVPVVSFFSGAGGLDLGLETAGYEHIALVEHNELFCSTLAFNRPSWKVLGPPHSSGDVSDVDRMIEQLVPNIGNRSFEGLFVGGPPCQPFSIAANQRFSKSGSNFKRIGFAHKTNGNLLFDYIALIKRFKPRAFLIENVPGLLDVDGGSQLKRAYRELERVGYDIHAPIILVAAKFSVPQNRTRLFVIGSRRGAKFIPPQHSTSLSPCSPVFKKSIRQAKNHDTREHSAESIARYMKLDYGARDQLGRVDRLDPTLPSKTIIAGGNSGGGRSHLHPYIPRTLSVRESARLQTFPDDYVFLGPSARQFTQVGNAVPPILGAQLANAIFDSIFK